VRLALVFRYYHTMVREDVADCGVICGPGNGFTLSFVASCGRRLMVGAFRPSGA